MKSVFSFLALGLVLGASTPTLAAATPEEAQRLTALFQSYLGTEPGIVSVTTAGESYAAKLDLTPLFAKVKDPTVSLSLSPLEWTLTDQGSGKWKVDQNQPLTFARARQMAKSPLSSPPALSTQHLAASQPVQPS